MMETPASWPPPPLDPAGPFATPLATLSWALFGMGGAVLLLVLAALAVALFGGGAARRWIADRRTIIAGGLVFPVIVLSATLAYGLLITSRLSAPPAPDEMRIRVIGEMWWWRVVYLSGERPLFETANEIRIPAGEAVTFELESADVIHSFWVPRLGAKLDMIPGRRNILRLQADEAGVFRGQCTEFCGAAHALMAFEVVAMSPPDFEAWSAQQTEQAEADASRGWKVFSESGCGACHVVRGTAANGLMGPDLTHFADRRTLAAGILPNDPATLRRWIADADGLKPGVRMPAYERLSEEDVDAVARYLESLE